MSKKLIVVALVLVLSVFAWVVSMAGERVDPTGVMGRLVEMDRSHTDAVQSFLNHLKLDYHPDFGSVSKEDMPFHATGWNEQYIHELFPGKNIEHIKSVTKATFSGTVLAVHREHTGRLFHVWHRYKDEAGVLVTVKLADRDEERTAMAIIGTGNPVYLSSDDLVCRISGHQVALKMARW